MIEYSKYSFWLAGLRFVICRTHSCALMKPAKKGRSKPLDAFVTEFLGKH